MYTSNLNVSIILSPAFIKRLRCLYFIFFPLNFSFILSFYFPRQNWIIFFLFVPTSLTFLVKSAHKRFPFIIIIIMIEWIEQNGEKPFCSMSIQYSVKRLNNLLQIKMVGHQCYKLQFDCPVFMFQHHFSLSKWRKAKVCIKTVSWINKLRKQKVFNVLFHFKKWNVMALILLFPFAYADATHSTLSHHQIFMDLMHDEQIKIWMNKRNKTLQPFHCNPILSIHWRFRSFVISSFRFFFSFYWVC